MFNKLFKSATKNQSFMIIGLCVLFTYIIVFPNIFFSDNYQPNHNQWGAFMAFFVRLSMMLLPESAIDKNVHLVLLGFFFICILIYGIYYFARIFEKNSEKHYGLFVGIIFFFIVFNYSLYTRRSNVAFAGTMLLYICFVMKFYLDSRKCKTLSFLLLFTLLSISLGLRKNAILLAPVAFYALLAIYDKTCRFSFYYKTLFSVLLSILSFSFSPIMEKSMNLKDDHGECVFMASDIYCMRLLKNKPVGAYSGAYGMFCQQVGYEPITDAIRRDWIMEIKEDIGVFIESRIICYLQFLSLGILPESVHSYLEKKYPNVKFPDRRDFALYSGVNHMMIDRNDDSYIQKEGFLAMMIKIAPWKLNERLTNPHGIFKKDWTIESRILLSAYFLVFLSLIFNLYRLIRRKSYDKSIIVALFVGVMSILYLVSFLPFTPTPSFNYHLFSFLSACLTIGLTIDSIKCMYTAKPISSLA